MKKGGVGGAVGVKVILIGCGLGALVGVAVALLECYLNFKNDEDNCWVVYQNHLDDCRRDYCLKTGKATTPELW